MVDEALADFFVGCFEHRLDEKGRCSLPSDFREILRDQGSDGAFFLIPPYAGRACHFGVSRSGLGRIIKSLPEREYASPGEREATRRHYTTRSKLVTYEANGRFILAQAQRESFGLPKGGDLVFAGYGRVFEIWPKADFERTVPGSDVEPAPIDPWDL